MTNFKLPCDIVTHAAAALLAVAAMTVAATPASAGTIVRFDTTLGSFDVELYDDVVPETVNNFLDYVLDGAYTNTLIHRSVPNFVIQGGGFHSDFSGVPSNPAIPLQYVLPNERGTLAMARTAAPNTATSQWFINTGNNSASLAPGGASADGYAVFGRVLGDGMDIVDAIAAVPRYNAGSPFNELPLRDFSPTTPIADHHKILVNSIAVVPEPSTLALGAAGLATLAICWRRRRANSGG